MGEEYKIPDFLLGPDREFTQEEKHFWKVWDEYHRRWPEGFNTIDTIITAEDEKELLRSLEECVEKNVPMKDVHPEWCTTA